MQILQSSNGAELIWAPKPLKNQHFWKISF